MILIVLDFVPHEFILNDFLLFKKEKKMQLIRLHFQCSTFRRNRLTVVRYISFQRLVTHKLQIKSDSKTSLQPYLIRKY